MTRSRSCEASRPSCSARVALRSADTTIPPGTLERGLLLRLRFALDLYVNLRPFTGVPGSIAEGCEFVVVRENTEGTYAGEGGFPAQGDAARGGDAGLSQHPHGCRALRALRLCARGAPTRAPAHPCAQDQRADVRRRLWQRTVNEVAPEFGDVALEYNHVDAACIYLVEQPRRYDVIVTDNLFGDILTDLAGAVSGGIGFAASANLNPARTGRPCSSRYTAQPMTSPARVSLTTRRHPLRRPHARLLG